MTVLPIMDSPAVIAEELADEIRWAVNNHPRSLQKRIGPSELGMTCTRTLLHRINGDPDPDPSPNSYRGVPWFPTIGNAMHEWLADKFRSSVMNVDPQCPHYLVEQRVNVGTVAGVDITGSADLFVVPSGCVVDWKVVGPTTLKRVKAARHPGQQYEWQANLYGRGFQRAGFTVNSVMIAFLPRNAEFSQRYMWSAPYDERVALQALQHVTGLSDLIRAVGIDTAASIYPLCSTEWCVWCAPLMTPKTFFQR